MNSFMAQSILWGLLIGVIVSIPVVILVKRYLNKRLEAQTAREEKEYQEKSMAMEAQGEKQVLLSVQNLSLIHI